jgi:hypothetical protein
LEINVPNVPLNSGDFQTAKLVCVTLMVLKTIFVTLILAIAIVNEALKVIIATNVLKETLDSPIVKLVVVMKMDLSELTAMMPQELAPVDPTSLDTDVISALLDILDSQIANLACVMMMVQEISLAMTTLENVLVEQT